MISQISTPMLAAFAILLNFLLSSGLVANPTKSEQPKQEGVVDEIQVTGQLLEVRGWAGAADPQNPVVAIRILLDGNEIFKGSFETQQRPDVARAKGNPEWLQSGWSIKAPLQAPLSEGKKKITALALLKNGDHIDLSAPKETVTVGPAIPSTPAANPPQLLGQLDEVLLEGNQLKVRGWVASADPSQQIQTILLKSGEETLYRGEFQIEERPDVAEALGKPDLVNSGWIVRLDWSGKPAPSSITPHFEIQTGEILLLPGPTATQASSAETAPPEALMGTRLAWLAAFLLAGGVGLVVYRVYQRRGNSSVPHNLAAPPLRITDWPALFVLAGVFFSIFASKLFLIAHFGLGIPYWDQWDSEARHLLVPFLEGRYLLADLFSPHAEHRIALTRLLVLGLFVLNGQWDPLVSMVAQAALHAGILSLFIALFAQIFNRYTWALFALMGALFYCLPFSWENTLWGFQSQFYFVLLSGLSGIWLTWKCVDLSMGWWFGLVFFCAGLFAMAGGLLAPAAVVCISFYRVLVSKGPRGRQWAGLAALVLVLFLAVNLLVNVPGHDHLKARSVSNFFEFVFKLAAWPTEIPWLGVVLHLPVLATGVFVLVRCPPRHDPSWFLAALGAWSVFTMVALSYGRANGPLESRYTDSLAFGLLTSLSCALYLATLVSGKSQKIAHAAVGIVVAIAAAGIFHIFSDDLLTEIPERKALEPIQKNHLVSFLATSDLQALENKPFLHIPYPRANTLAQVLRQKSLQEVLPAAIHPGLSPAQAIFSEKSFVANGGVYPTTQPVNPKPHFGSLTQAGYDGISQLRLEYPAPPTASRFVLLVSGYPLKDGMELFLETENGKKIPIPVTENPRETWQEVVFKNPGVPFSLVAVDGSPTAWLGIGLPTPLGRLSVWTKWLLAHWWIFGATGVGCFFAGFLFSSAENRRLT